MLKSNVPGEGDSEAKGWRIYSANLAPVTGKIGPVLASKVQNFVLALWAANCVLATKGPAFETSHKSLSVSFIPTGGIG
jgi:hypothetical protein